MRGPTGRASVNHKPRMCSSRFVIMMLLMSYLVCSHREASLR